jgi:hypothetical protein
MKDLRFTEDQGFTKLGEVWFLSRDYLRGPTTCRQARDYLRWLWRTLV